MAIFKRSKIGLYDGKAMTTNEISKTWKRLLEEAQGNPNKICPECKDKKPVYNKPMRLYFRGIFNENSEPEKYVPIYVCGNPECGNQDVSALPNDYKPLDEK